MINFNESSIARKYNFDIIKQTDKNIINELILLNEETVYKIISLHVTNFSDTDFSININDKLPDNIVTLISANSEIFNSFKLAVTLNDTSVYFNIIRDYNIKSFDRLVFINSLDDSKNDNALKYDILRVELRKRFKAINSNQVIDEIDKEVNEFYLKRESELAKLEGLSKEILVNSQKYLREQEEELRLLKIRTQEKYDSDKKTLEDNYNEKAGKLIEKENALNEKEKHIDDRESKHVRREIRNNMKEEFKSRNTDFHLTEGTNNKRQIIHIFSIILLVLFGSGFITFSVISVLNLLNGKVDDTQTLLSVYLKNVIFAIGFGSTSVFYIRWNNKWFEQHSNEEFKLKKLEIDIDRASWLVEMALEWENERKTEIPELLIDRLSQNLFNDSKEEEVKLHPADQLASSLLGAASGLKMKTPDGSELSYTKRGLNKLNKDK
ncbi:MAG: hypothetical protein PHN88_02710 [Ignavibacteria bacterium]|nr:hypothetical protein [Ignavibacteria bacterium]